jgi:hypothetical protein
VRRFAGPAAVAAAVLAALPLLLLLDGEARTAGYRAYAVVLGLLALRSVVAWADDQPELPVPPPFRRRWRREPPARTPESRAERTVRLATFSAGDAHRGLLPALREVADERLRARHRLALDDPRAAQVLPVRTYELLRPDRPRPAERRGPGLSRERIDAALTDLEAL